MTFWKRHRGGIIKLSVLLILTILLCIPATIRGIVGVFGFAAYPYLVAGYAAFIMQLKNAKWRLNRQRTAILIAFLLCTLLTLHIAFAGKDIVNNGFGGYVAGAFSELTVGGVVLSLISLPIVLPCKHTASLVIFFLATMIFGFFLLKPYIFFSKKEGAPKEKSPALFHETLPAEESPVLREDTALDITPLSAEPSKASPAPEEFPEEPLDSKAEAYKILFGAEHTEKPRRAAVQRTPIDPHQEKKTRSAKDNLFDPAKRKNPFLIVEGMEATRVPPADAPYTNDFLRKNQQEAKERLLNVDSAEDYRSRYEREDEEKKTLKTEIEQELGYQPYVPEQVLFDDTKPVTPPPAPVRPFLEKDETESITATTVEAEPLAIRDKSFAAAVRHKINENTASLAVAEEKRTPVPPIERKSAAYEEKQTAAVKKPEQAEAPKLKLTMPYSPPRANLLEDHVSPGFSPYVDNYEEIKEVIEVKLKNYNIHAKLIKAIKGPTITRCILELDEKCPIQRVYTAKQDIKRLLKANGDITVISQIPNSDYFGIEVPNSIRSTVSFKEIVCSPEFVNGKGEILIALGKTADGRVLVEDLAEMPHALIAGTTGSGKSVCINAILTSILYRYSPEEVKLILIDLKRVEMGVYAGLPHMLLRNPLHDIKEITSVLKWIREETERRFVTFEKNSVRDLKEYNLSLPKDAQLPRIVIVIDEASELMTSDAALKKTVEGTLSSLARVARAAGIHLIFATQNPIKQVITNEIQNNLNTKIAFAVGDYNHSMVIFKAKGAESLLGRGDMYIKRGTQMVRGQCAYISTAEILAITDYIKNANEVDFDEDMIERILNGSTEEIDMNLPVGSDRAVGVPFDQRDLDGDDDFQALVLETLRICVESNRVSTTYVQRKLSKGYNTIANVMDYLERKGLVSEQVNKKRSLLITKEQFEELYANGELD